MAEGLIIAACGAIVGALWAVCIIRQRKTREAKMAALLESAKESNRTILTMAEIQMPCQICQQSVVMRQEPMGSGKWIGKHECIATMLLGGRL